LSEHNIILKQSWRVQRLSLSIERDGALKLVAPSWYPKSKINEFVRNHESWIQKKLFERKSSLFFPKGSGTKRHFAKNKEEARKFIALRVEFWNAELGFAFSKIAIRNQKSRWGSCSKKGTLNFNYRLLFLPAELADYVIVHELCHLKHFDHSKNFWDEVRRTLPEYKTQLKQLKRYSLV
jgi:hypothetical protein